MYCIVKFMFFQSFFIVCVRYKLLLLIILLILNRIYGTILYKGGVSMTFNIIAGFILPWVSSLYLYIKDKKTLLTIAPLGAAIALLYNSVGFHLLFWTLHPFSDGRLALLPFDLGAYPVFASFLIYFIKKYRSKPYLIILLFTLITTLIEYMFLIRGKVIYYNNWNIAWTFISYVVPYISCYVYYLILRRNDFL